MNRLLNRFGWHLSRDRDPMHRFALLRFHENLIDCFPLILEKLIQRGAVQTVLQIGANDGLDGDPITEFLLAKKLRSLLVEPQPETAARLRKLHEMNERVTVAEIAIGSVSGTLTLWRSKTPNFGEYRLDRITSADRGHVEHFLRSRNLPVEVESIEVPALRVSEALAKYQMPHPDLVVIDAEGLDKMILDQFELESDAPKLIHFETSNLSGEDLAECRKRLVANGYCFSLTERDAACVHESVFDLLRPELRSLRL